MTSALPPPYSEKDHYQQGLPPAPVYMGPPIIVGDYPVQCACPQCRSIIVTRTEKTNGLLAWLICAVLFLIGLWLCCLIPFCVDKCKDTEHYCPACGALLAVSKRCKYEQEWIFIWL